MPLAVVIDDQAACGFRGAMPYEMDGRWCDAEAPGQSGLADRVEALLVAGGHPQRCFRWLLFELPQQVRVSTDLYGELKGLLGPRCLVDVDDLVGV